MLLINIQTSSNVTGRILSPSGIKPSLSQIIITAETFVQKIQDVGNRYLEMERMFVQVVGFYWLGHYAHYMFLIKSINLKAYIKHSRFTKWLIPTSSTCTCWQSSKIDERRKHMHAGACWSIPGVHVRVSTWCWCSASKVLKILNES